MYVNNCPNHFLNNEHVEGKYLKTNENLNIFLHISLGIIKDDTAMQQTGFHTHCPQNIALTKVSLLDFHECYVKKCGMDIINE